ncbi:septum formation initiator family protein [Corynebacterium senegalense]|uniref:septum formation initiator family protein n=1 Tax=Corynebacterium senegalense TaxID=2080750 RepID=UPI001FE933FE|nr:septum formation initiator family protein [Corynebacterium senegalense]
MTSRATQPQPSRRPRRRATEVPVASRDRARAEAKKKKRKLPFQGDITGLAIVISVLLVVLVAVAVPLRNYYEGRSEIARLNASIQELEQRKADLEGDIAKYRDEDYVKQEARRRLGMMEPGETAWRVIDPRMTHSDTITTDEIPDTRPWPQVMVDSLRQVPGEETQGEETNGDEAN